jgi:hypothetical protein
MLLAQLKLGLEQMALQIDEVDAVLNKSAHENEDCQRLVAIPGVGPVTATALIARSAMEQASGRAGSSRPGWEWFHANTQPVASRSCSGSKAVCRPSGDRDGDYRVLWRAQVETAAGDLRRALPAEGSEITGANPT